jgi:tetratricopeptide (TPR) repeat protein
MMTQRSLATSAIECARLLNNLSTQLLDKEWETRAALSQPSIEDQDARYKIWGGNLGAFQRLPATSSLDYRVRESPKVATQIQELLEDLRHALQKVSAIASGNIPNRVAEPDEEDDDFEDEDKDDYEERELGEGSDGSEDGVDEHVIIEIDVDEKHHQLSEASELFKSVKDTITSLFRISIIIRQASPRDRFAKALAAQQEPFDDRFDIGHVSHKFPILNTKEKEWFKERVGKAITQRRQYLRYARNHRGKLAREPQDLWQPEDACSKINLLPVLSQAGKTNPTKPTSTLAPTAASTLRLKNIAIQDNDFQDDWSQTSYAVSLGEDDDEPYLQLPSLDEVSRGATTFECPLCWTIQDIQKESSWRKHVFGDLKPYICTFEDCDIKLFSDRREWFEHELLHHRAQWHCDFCGENDFRSLKIFQDHIHSRHIQSMTDDQLDAIGEASKRFVNYVPALDCPFCHDWEAKLRLANLNISADEIVVVTPDQFRSHVGAHMQQLALFSIPRGFLQDDADTKSVTSMGNPRSNVAGLRRAEMTLEFGSPEDALKQLQKFHDQTPNDMEVHLLLSKCYHEIGNESAAHEHSGRAQALRAWAQRGNRSDKHSDSGTKGSKELFVQVMETSSRVEEAEELQVQVMETTKRALGEEHPSTLTSMTNLASTYSDQGRWKEAEELEVQVVETRKRVFGEENPETLISMANLASTYSDQGRWREAEELQVQVMETTKRVFGEEHPNTLTSMTQLGSVLSSQGKYNEAEAMYCRALEGYEKALGRDHSLTLIMVNNLGNLYRDQGKLSEAEKMYQRALQGFEKAWGPEHPSTLDTVNNLGNLYLKLGRLDEAEKMYQRALQGFEKRSGYEHERCRWLRRALATLRRLPTDYTDSR